MQSGRAGPIAFAASSVAAGAVAGVELLAAVQVTRSRQLRDSLPGGESCDGLAFKTGEPNAKRFSSSEQLQAARACASPSGPASARSRPSVSRYASRSRAFLPGTIRRAVEQPGERRHHGIRRPACAAHRDARTASRRSARTPSRDKVGTDAARAPKMRIIEDRLPGQGRGAESRDIVAQVADLLRVAIGAAFAPVDDAPALLAGGQAPADARATCWRICSSSTRPGQTPSSRTDIAKNPSAADAGHQVRHAEQALHESAPAPGAARFLQSAPVRRCLERRAGRRRALR